MTGPADKVALRRRMRMVRDLIDDRLLRSVQLWAALAELPEYRSAATVMAFVGVPGEPDTDSLLARLRHDGKTVVLPRVVDGEIEPALVGSGMAVGAFGVAEPQGEAVRPSALDLVVVPGLAFTADGSRLGQGGGHYDRFLATVDAPTVGVCFAEQLVDSLPLEPHDVRVLTVLSA